MWNKIESNAVIDELKAGRKVVYVDLLGTVGTPSAKDCTTKTVQMILTYIRNAEADETERYLFYAYTPVESGEQTDDNENSSESETPAENENTESETEEGGTE